MKRIVSVFGIGALLLAGTVPAQAQHRHRGGSGLGGVVGINATVARPVGEFREFVEWGGGAGLYGLVTFDRGRHVGLRFDGTMIIYGHERFEVPLSETVRRVFVDVSTNNFIASLGVGPQIILGTGAIRPYVFGTGGFAYFGTVSDVSGTSSYESFASSTNFDDFTFALTGGGGLLLWVSRGRHPVSLDLSVQQTYHGVTEYLKRGSIVEHFDGSITVFPIRSKTNLVAFRAGVAIGI